MLRKDFAVLVKRSINYLQLYQTQSKLTFTYIKKLIDYYSTTAPKLFDNHDTVLQLISTIKSVFVDYLGDYKDNDIDMKEVNESVYKDFITLLYTYYQQSLSSQPIERMNQFSLPRILLPLLIRGLSLEKYQYFNHDNYLDCATNLLEFYPKKILTKLVELNIIPIPELFADLPLCGYKELHPIGEGAYGYIYKAIYRKDKNTFLTAAVKKPFQQRSRQAQNESKQNILDEFTIQHPLQSPFIIAAYHLDLNQFSIVFEFGNAGNLEDKILCDTPYSGEFVFRMTHDVIRGIEYLHNQNIVHCDIKPDNIILSFSDKLQAKICDLGLAIKADDQKKSFRGTLAYICENDTKNSFAGDIYAFGLTLFQMIERDQFASLKSITNPKLPAKSNADNFQWTTSSIPTFFKTINDSTLINDLKKRKTANEISTLFQNFSPNQTELIEFNCPSPQTKQK